MLRHDCSSHATYHQKETLRHFLFGNVHSAHNTDMQELARLKTRWKCTEEERHARWLKCNTAEGTFVWVLVPAGGRSHKAAGSLLTDGFEGVAVRDCGTFSITWLTTAHIRICSMSALLSAPWRPSPLQWAHQGCCALGSAARVPESPALQSARTAGRKLKTGDQDHASITRRDGKRWCRMFDNGASV